MQKNSGFLKACLEDIFKSKFIYCTAFIVGYEHFRPAIVSEQLQRR